VIKIYVDTIPQALSTINENLKKKKKKEKKPPSKLDEI
jgi:hypothetical protein